MTVPVPPLVPVALCVGCGRTVAPAMHSATTGIAIFIDHDADPHALASPMPTYNGKPLNFVRCCDGCAARRRAP